MNPEDKLNFQYVYNLLCFKDSQNNAKGSYPYIKVKTIWVAAMHKQMVSRSASSPDSVDKGDDPLQ